MSQEHSGLTGGPSITMRAGSGHVRHPPEPQVQICAPRLRRIASPTGILCSLAHNLFAPCWPNVYGMTQENPRCYLLGSRYWRAKRQSALLSYFSRWIAAPCIQSKRRMASVQHPGCVCTRPNPEYSQRKMSCPKEVRLQTLRRTFSEGISGGSHSHRSSRQSFPEVVRKPQSQGDNGQCRVCESGGGEN